MYELQVLNYPSLPRTLLSNILWEYSIIQFLIVTAFINDSYQKAMFYTIA